MFERDRDIPRAYASQELDADEMDLVAVQWALEQREASGDPILLYAAVRGKTQGHPYLAALEAKSFVCSETWQTLLRSRWSGGIVVALWPDEKHLFEMDEHYGTTALVAVTWNEQEVLPWARAKGALVLGEAEPPGAPELDPVVAAAVGSMGAGINQNNVLAQRERGHLASCLKVLKDGGYRLDADAIYEEALANGWRGKNANGLRELVEKVNAGRRVVGMDPGRLRPTVLDHWRELAAQD